MTREQMKKLKFFGWVIADKRDKPGRWAFVDELRPSVFRNKAVAQEAINGTRNPHYYVPQKLYIEK